LHEDYVHLLPHLAQLFLKQEMFQDKSCKENQNTYFMFSISENRAVYELKWKNMTEPDRPQITI
jgi:hypothetical protein